MAEDSLDHGLGRIGRERVLDELAQCDKGLERRCLGHQLHGLGGHRSRVRAARRRADEYEFLDALGHLERELLRAAAVLGNSFRRVDLLRLADATELSLQPGELDDRLASLEARRLLGDGTSTRVRAEGRPPVRSQETLWEVSGSGGIFG